MSDPKISGSCLCGAVSYSAEGDPAAVALCHCDDCQKTSGAAFSVNVIVMTSDFTLDGEDALKTFETIGEETQQPRQRKFCATCGSPVVTYLAEMDGMVIIKAGTLDDRSWLAPEMEVWCESKQPWVDGTEERGEFPTGLPS